MQKMRKLIPSPARRFLRRIVKPKAHRSSDYKSRYGVNKTTHHDHFTESREALVSGTLPREVERLARLIPGKRVLEIGAAEGILSLALARQSRDKVYSLDVTPVRHEAAQELGNLWIEAQLIDDSSIEYILGDIFQHFDILDRVDTVVASRVIYYFHERVDQLLAEIALRVPTIALIGNAQKAERWNAGRRGSLGKFAYYATVEGMSELLKRHGYEIILTDTTNDPVVVGTRSDQ